MDSVKSYSQPIVTEDFMSRQCVENYLESKDMAEYESLKEQVEQRASRMNQLAKHAIGKMNDLCNPNKTDLVTLSKVLDFDCSSHAHLSYYPMRISVTVDKTFDTLQEFETFISNCYQCLRIPREE